MAIGRSSHHMNFIVSFLISLCLTANVAIANDKNNARGQNAPAHVDSHSDEFHKPATKAEEMIDYLLTVTSRKPDFFAYITNKPWRNKAKGKGFSVFFSQKLQKNWINEEIRLLNLWCDGKYIEGDMCGLDINPFTCAQDYLEEGYMYKTISSDNRTAIIAYRWPHLPEVVATYRLIFQNNQWIVDAVDCGDSTKFNWDE
jgi:hypothetical protein